MERSAAFGKTFLFRAAFAKLRVRNTVGLRSEEANATHGKPSLLPSWLDGKPNWEQLMALLKDQRLRVFHAVARLKSFTEAGHELHLTQQAISFHIRSLESELGVSLFTRKHHTIDLTHAGSVLFVHSDKILALYEEAFHSLSDLKAGSLREIRVSATNSISKYTMPAAIRAFRTRHPTVNFTLEVGNSAQAVRYLDEGAVDAAVVSDGVSIPSEYRVTPLFSEEIAFIVANDHAWASQPEITINDLIQAPLIIREKGSGTRATLERYLAKKNITMGMLNVVMVLGSPEAVLVAAQGGEGAGLLSSLRARHVDSVEGVVMRKLVGCNMKRDFLVVRPQNKSAAPLVSDFVSILQATVAQSVATSSTP